MNDNQELEQLQEKIRQLSPSLVADSLKNLEITLEYDLKKELEPEEALQELAKIRAEGSAEELRQTIVKESVDRATIERWGKSTLLYLSMDPELRPKVQEAIEDAEQGGLKVIDPVSLIILGVVLVLLKWRPRKIQVDKDGWHIEWVDNDTKAVSDLASLVAGAPLPLSGEVQSPGEEKKNE
ncbi:MAG TPA: hypothetical protein VH186_33905 [Chloroflexia bacterium]|nr:hypothetical protein [Chloroflexia bacterium]